MIYKVGDIVELKEEYPYIKIKNARGFITKISYPNKGKERLYYVKVPPVNIMSKVKNLLQGNLIVNENEIRKID